MQYIYWVVVALLAGGGTVILLQADPHCWSDKGASGVTLLLFAAWMLSIRIAHYVRRGGS